MLKQFLALAEVEILDSNWEERIYAHARILARKPLLRDVFIDLHKNMRELDERHFGATPGLRIEIGAGVAPMRGTYPDVLATDVVPALGLDRVLDAQAMDLPEWGVRAIYGQNMFHHLPEPRRFFDELVRVLHPGGGAILIEPFHGPFASLLYPRLFRSEGFDKRSLTWEADINGPMSGANQALSYIVFQRDRARFETEYPKLRIVEERPLASALRYLCSGGLNFRQLVPNWSASVLRGIERALSPAAGFWALHQVIVLRREP
jgi:SAM-dependent methyltransferase